MLQPLQLNIRTLLAKDNRVFFFRRASNVYLENQFLCRIVQFADNEFFIKVASDSIVPRMGHSFHSDLINI